MVILFNHRFPLAAILELVLAATVLFAAFAGVLAGHHPGLDLSAGVSTTAAIVFAIVQLAAIGTFGLYRVDREQPVRIVAAKYALSLLVGTVLCYAIFALLPEHVIFRESIPGAVLLGGLGLLVVRMLMASGVQLDRFNHRVLVLGADADAAAVARAGAFLSEGGVTLVGFYPVGNGNSQAVSPQLVLSNALSVEETVERLGVDEVVVAVREQRGGLLPLRQLLDCRLRGIRVTDMSAFFERVTGEVPVDSLKASWLIYGQGFRQGRARRVIKRAFDVLAASALLLLAAPVMLLTAIAIYLESGFPVIFRQERVGFGGRPFMLLKFRSMCADAEKEGVPRWASNGDPRVTRVGKFIRRCRIDELPQIFNVLKGEMSFVGPRPERPYFVAQLSHQVPFYGARHTVKPGVTGWAQVQYSYGASLDDAVRKLQFDLYYIKNHTLLLDLVILFKTVQVVLLGEGAR